MPDAACLTCNELAPFFCNGGYLGYPSLDGGSPREELGDAWDDMPTFGDFFQAYASLRLVSAELTFYREFLKRHHGHKMYLSLDDDEDLPNVFVEDREGTSGGNRPSMDSNPPGHRSGHVRYRCSACSVSLRTPEPDCILAFEPATLDVAEARAAGRLLSSPGMEEGWTHELSGVIDPYSELFYSENTLLKFLDQHLDHGIEASFEPSDS